MLPEHNIFLEKLFRESFDSLTLYAKAALGNTAFAKDVVQDTFHEAVSHIDILMVHKNPGGWLMKTLKNKIRIHNRSQRRYIRRFLSLNSDTFQEPASPDEYVRELFESDNLLTLEKIKQALTPEELHLLERLIFDKESHLTVAKELGITVWSSQKRLQRVREKLYKQFPERKKKK